MSSRLIASSQVISGGAAASAASCSAHWSSVRRLRLRTRKKAMITMTAAGVKKEPDASAPTTATSQSERM